MAGVVGVGGLEVGEGGGVVADEEEGGEDLGELYGEVDGGFEEQEGGEEDGCGGQDAEGAADIEVAAGDEALGLLLR